MKVVTVHLPELYIEAIDGLIEKRLYPNRADAIRTALRDFIKEEAEASGRQRTDVLTFVDLFAPRSSPSENSSGVDLRARGAPDLSKPKLS